MKRISTVWLLLLPIAAGCRLGDSISQSAWETDRALTEYRWSGNTQKVLKHLSKYDGEAPGTQKFMTFAQWSLAHPRDFVRLSNAVPPKESRALSDSLSYAIQDIGLETRFKSAFHGEKSRFIQETLSKL